MLQGKEVGARLDHRGRPDDDLSVDDQLTHARQRRLLSDAVLQEVGYVALRARQLTADAQEVDAVVGKHAADLVHGAVGVSHEQQAFAVVGSQLRECFAHHELQGHGGLAGARRTHEEEIITGLLGFEDNVVDAGVVAS